MDDGFSIEFFVKEWWWCSKKKKAEFFLRQKEKKKTSKSRFITSTKKGSGISLSSFPEAAGRRRV